MSTTNVVNRHDRVFDRAAMESAGRLAGEIEHGLQQHDAGRRKQDSGSLRQGGDCADGRPGHGWGPMEVFAVTIFMSLAFAVLFAVLFFAERSQRQRRSVEQMALLPLDTDPGADAPRR